MADFMTNLWTSVFTPGTTPTLLLATNITFASLQLVLLALLVVTYSIHFVILSFLCGGLWVSINWFARELAIAQRQAQTEQDKEEKRIVEPGAEADEGDDEATGTGTETEVEGGRTVRRSMRVKAKRSVTPLEGLRTGREVEGEARMRRSVRDLSGGETSTDSEWEKVEGER